MRTNKINPDLVSSSQKVHARPNAFFFKLLLAEQDKRGCSLGETLIRLAAVGLGLSEDAGVCIKLPPGPKAKLRRNGTVPK